MSPCRRDRLARLGFTNQSRGAFPAAPSTISASWRPAAVRVRGEDGSGRSRGRIERFLRMTIGFAYHCTSALAIKFPEEPLLESVAFTKGKNSSAMPRSISYLSFRPIYPEERCRTPAFHSTCTRKSVLPCSRIDRSDSIEQACSRLPRNEMLEWAQHLDVPGTT